VILIHLPAEFPERPILGDPAYLVDLYQRWWGWRASETTSAAAAARRRWALLAVEPDRPPQRPA